MKRLFILILALVTIQTATFAQSGAAPFSIPEIRTWQSAQGFFTPSSRIVVQGGQEARRIAHILAADYRTLFGKQLTVTTQKAQAGDIVLSLSKDKVLGEEGYRMKIEKTATLTATTPKGLYWATRTLLQLSEQHPDLLLPMGEGEDIPLYKVRGFMLDCGRKFFPMSYLRDLVKTMSYYKMNTLQIHLNDNGFKQFFGNDWDKTQAAFRLESNRFPGLTATDGHYTKQEFIDFQRYADSLGVEIIPEIDVPAHSLAFTRYRPSLKRQGYDDDHLDIMNPATYTFLDSLFTEYLEGKHPVFIGKRVSIGTDEYSNAQQEVVEKFRYFTDRYIRLVERYGKTAIVWGSLKHAKGTTPVKAQGVWMSQWSLDFADPKASKKAGYSIISIPDGYTYIVPGAGYYYDYFPEEWLYKNWHPAMMGGEPFEEGDPSLLGGMFAVWNDHPGNGITAKDVHHRLFPALQTMAVKFWNGTKVAHDYALFDKQRKLLSEAPGLNVLGRLPQDSIAMGEQTALSPNTQNILPIVEIGYDYRVSFTVEGKKEARGTVLFQSPNAIFYLSDPQTGTLSFEREGYISRFRYRLPEGQTVRIAIEGTNKETRLYVNDRLIENLQVQTLFTMNEEERVAPFTSPQPYDLRMTPSPRRMYLHRTLFFPLQNTGNFKSKITNLKVKHLK